MVIGLPEVESQRIGANDMQTITTWAEYSIQVTNAHTLPLL